MPAIDLLLLYELLGREVFQVYWPCKKLSLVILIQTYSRGIIRVMRPSLISVALSISTSWSKSPRWYAPPPCHWCNSGFRPTEDSKKWCYQLWALWPFHNFLLKENLEKCFELSQPNQSRSMKRYRKDIFIDDLRKSDHTPFLLLYVTRSLKPGGVLNLYF